MSEAVGRTVNQLELAALFGVHTATIRDWVRKGCPVVEHGSRGKSGKYDTASVIRWREDRAALAAAGDAEKMDIEEARRRKLAAEAEQAEMALAIQRREYVPVEAVGKLVSEEYATVRALFTAMPGEIAPDLEGLSPFDLQECLSDKVSEILDELSADGGTVDYGLEDEASAGEAGGSEATTQT